jgi:hypothetical protein
MSSSTTNYFMSVPLVCHLHQLSTITGTVRKNRKLLPQQFKNKIAVGQKNVLQIWSPSCVFSARRNHKKILSFFNSAMPQPKKRKYGENMVAIHI